jgi:hypothetical protein
LRLKGPQPQIKIIEAFGDAFLDATASDTDQATVANIKKKLMPAITNSIDSYERTRKTNDKLTAISTMMTENSILNASDEVDTLMQDANIDLELKKTEDLIDSAIKKKLNPLHIKISSLENTIKQLRQKQPKNASIGGQPNPRTAARQPDESRDKADAASNDTTDAKESKTPKRAQRSQPTKRTQRTKGKTKS